MFLSLIYAIGITAPRGFQAVDESHDGKSDPAADPPRIENETVG
jgi:hypothetical protein